MPRPARKRVARRAGVSTKTLYRLVPNKAALFEGMVSDRLDRFLSDVNLRAIDYADIETGAVCGADGLRRSRARSGSRRASAHGTAGDRQFPDLARTFYQNGIARNVAALADWLRMQQKRGLIELDDADEAAGILIGMVAFAPQRAAVFGGLPLPSRADRSAGSELRGVVSEGMSGRSARLGRHFRSISIF